MKQAYDLWKGQRDQFGKASEMFKLDTCSRKYTKR